MAFRTWAKVLWAALRVSALVGAGQLGMAYGLRLVRIDRTFDVTVRDQWAAQLTWVCWFAMVATVAGALAGGRLAARDLRRLGGGAMAALAVAAALGAAVVVPLTMLPARFAVVAGVDPVAAVALCAVLGTVLGAGTGYVALAFPVARWSLGAVAATVWVIGIGAVLPSLGRVNPAAVRLGVLDVGALTGSQRAALLTMPALALLTGAGLGWAARRQGRPMVTVGLAGLPGPALLTLGYLVAGPGSGRYQQVPYWAAMLALGAGALGSVLVAVLRRGDERWPGIPPDAAPDDTTQPATTQPDTDQPDTDQPDTAFQPAPPLSAPPLPRRERPTGIVPDGASTGPGRGGPAATPAPPGATASPTPTPPGATASRAPTPEPTSAPRPAPSAATAPPPHPVQVSPPLPTPTPTSAPLPPPRPVERRPGAAQPSSGGPRRSPRRPQRSPTPPEQTGEAGEAATAERRRAARAKPLRPKDEEHVDWVNRLGEDPSPMR